MLALLLQVIFQLVAALLVRFSYSRLYFAYRELVPPRAHDVSDLAGLLLPPGFRFWYAVGADHAGVSPCVEVCVYRPREVDLWGAYRMRRYSGRRQAG